MIMRLTPGSTVPDAVAASLTDGELVLRFIESGQEQAFALLVERHSALVKRVCRRYLNDANDADDAYQATFVLLALKAASIRCRESVASWLFGVAARVSVRIRRQSVRRAIVRAQAHAGKSPAASPESDLGWRELCQALREEMSHLPDKQRQPLALCYWQGLTQDEAARLLGWPRGTLKRRLESGRDKLRQRLAARGLAFSLWLLLCARTPRQACAASAAPRTPPCARPAAPVGKLLAGVAVSQVSLALFSGKVSTLVGMAAALAMSFAGTVAVISSRPSSPSAMARAVAPSEAAVASSIGSPVTLESTSKPAAPAIRLPAPPPDATAGRRILRAAQLS
jgi:RNA polymerase sigma factor (sigma-70 family)